MNEVKYFGSALQKRVEEIKSIEGLSAELINAENAKKFWISEGIVEIAKFYAAAEIDIKEKSRAYISIRLFLNSRVKGTAQKPCASL